MKVFVLAALVTVVSCQPPYVQHNHLQEGYQEQYSLEDYYKPVYLYERPYYGYHAPENQPASIKQIIHFIKKFHSLRRP
ncbi:hypothetical protein OUZ56_002308 [Daphnia magna]|uniref:Uncharacterized protein n=1 Tax=Daphnia magna TaxID=35525 RepID=A0ABR0A590_9CRUS|nr:hypothetical protein OUZ56_002308 [Daphnia magna]